MNKTVKEAYEKQENEYKGYIPELEIGEECELNDVWDGNGEAPDESYSYQISDSEWINYEFEVIEEKENQLDTIIKITTIEII